MSKPVIETDRLVRTFVRIRDARKALKTAFVTEDGALKKKQRLVENEMLRRAIEQNVTSFVTADGTTYKHEDQHVSIADPDEFWPFVIKEGDLGFFEQRPSLAHVREYQKNHKGKLPPGIRMFREDRMRVRAKRNGGDDDVASDD